MTLLERNQVVAETLLAVASALGEGAAGPTDYWFKKLGERLVEIAKKRINDTEHSG